MTTTKSTGATRAGTVLATRPLLGWRTVDLLTIAFLGVDEAVSEEALAELASLPQIRQAKALRF